MNNTGNMAFMAMIILFSILATVGIAVLGLTIPSLALVFLCVILGIVFGRLVENIVNKGREDKIKEQDLGIWPDDEEDHVNQD